jgi:hypothetical protein
MRPCFCGENQRLNARRFVISGWMLFLLHKGNTGVFAESFRKLSPRERFSPFIERSTVCGAAIIFRALFQ